jgi:uncharacterized protein with NRDE domain
MCLVAIARHAHPRWPLLLLANRDEFHARPSAPAHWWDESPDLLGGRDLAAGGSWLAVSRSGRFAVITNQPARKTGLRPELSRGSLVRGFVADPLPPAAWLGALAGTAGDYAGFCLVAGDATEVLALASPGPPGPLALGPGVFAMSNAPLAERWPKVEQLREELARRLAAGRELPAEELLGLVGPHNVTRSAAPGAGGLPSLAEVPHLPFIIGADYGTRCSTLFRVAADGQCEFIERRFDAGARITGESRYDFRLEKIPPAS